ncbi:MAG: hypothetical protein Q4A96_01550 [Candidatus Saccharibacteria bacterium]|nr:hypothetical protein [Candidatus Saccharibacteria bacterium]
MRKIRFGFDEQRHYSFIYNGSDYEVSLVSVENAPIFQGINIPANYFIRIRKEEDNGLVQTEYYIHRHYGKTEPSYFCLGPGDYIMLQTYRDDYDSAYGILYAKIPKDINDYALRVSQEMSLGGIVTNFGIRSVNDLTNRGKINCRRLFKLKNGEFVLDLKSQKNQIYYEFFKQTIYNFIDLTRYCYAQPKIADERILPCKTERCVIKETRAKMQPSNKYYKANFVNEFTADNPQFIEEALSAKEHDYTIVTIGSRILGDLEDSQLDCYIFKESRNRAYKIAYHDSIQFIHLMGYSYHIRFQANILGRTPKVVVFKESREIYEAELGDKDLETEIKELGEDKKKEIIATLKIT